MEVTTREAELTTRVIELERALQEIIDVRKDAKPIVVITAMQDIAKKVLSKPQPCNHYYVPVDAYNQNGEFVCQKCNQRI